MVSPDDAEAVLGKGYRLRGITAEVVPNGFWPLDFGGALGEPVTRGIAGETALAERRRTIRPRHGAEGGRTAGRSRRSTPGRPSRENSKAGPLTPCAAY